MPEKAFSVCIKDSVFIDPCCGSGGMFVQSIKFVEAHSGNKKEVSIYGQEYTNTTFKLAKMNLAIRGISANLGEMAANTFTNDQHKDLKADFIMANPPFNQKEWRGALSDDGTELKIRQQLIENDLVEAIVILPRSLFYTTDISVTLWILNKNKHKRTVEQNGKLVQERFRWQAEYEKLLNWKGNINAIQELKMYQGWTAMITLDNHIPAGAKLC